MNEYAVISIITRKLVEAGGKINIPLLKGDSFFEAIYDSNGIYVSNLNTLPFLPWSVFVETIKLLNEKGGQAIKGDAMNCKLGEVGLPFDSIEGRIAHIVYGKQLGDSAFRRVTPISCILAYCEVCKSEHGKLYLAN
ncbi:MAG TPA: hypothetical protein VEF53_05285 [Patescibacteria group bacterium]|nr:hypothetical protein [Patescibacteria group bacterium]